ncbi:hypothetical protein Tco_1399934 [Tanacetum coccineum]
MKEYVQFKTVKALRNGQAYNWETAKYGMISWCLDDVDTDILRFFETKFSGIVYDDALKLEFDFSSELEPNYELTNDINLDNETSLSEYLFFYEIPSADNLQFDKGNDDDKIGIKQFSRDIFVDTYVDENKETSHDTICDFFTIKAFVIKIMIQKYFSEGMPLNIIKNLYVPFGIPFDPKLFYKDGAYTSIADAKVHRVQTLNFAGLTDDMDRDISERLQMQHTDVEGQLGGLRRQLSWRQFIAILGLHTVEEMEIDGEPLRRLCHMLIAFTIDERGKAPEKVTTTDLFYLRSMDEGTVCALWDVTEQSLQTLTVKVGAAGGAAKIHPEAPQEDVPAGQEGGQADPTPQQAP